MISLSKGCQCKVVFGVIFPVVSHAFLLETHSNREGLSLFPILNTKLCFLLSALYIFRGEKFNFPGLYLLFSLFLSSVFLQVFWSVSDCQVSANGTVPGEIPRRAFWSSLFEERQSMWRLTTLMLKAIVNFTFSGFLSFFMRNRGIPDVWVVASGI